MQTYQIVSESDKSQAKTFSENLPATKRCSSYRGKIMQAANARISIPLEQAHGSKQSYLDRGQRRNEETLLSVLIP